LVLAKRDQKADNIPFGECWAYSPRFIRASLWDAGLPIGKTIQDVMMKKLSNYFL